MPPVTPTASLARRRAAVAAGFMVQGFVFISLTTRLPDFSDLWSLSEVELSLLLLGLVLLAGLGTLATERLAPGSAPRLCSGPPWSPWR